MTVRLDMTGHADYPHNPGTLYDCPICETVCYCAELQADQIIASEDEEPTECIACAIGREEQRERAQRLYGPRKTQ